MVLWQAVKRAQYPDPEESAGQRQEHDATFGITRGERLQRDADADAGQDRAWYQEAVLAPDDEDRQQREPDEQHHEATDVRLQLPSQEEEPDPRDDHR